MTRRFKWFWGVVLLLGVGGVRGEDLPLGAIPAERTKAFRLVTNGDFTKVAAIDQWGAEHKWYVVMDNLVWEFYTELDVDSAQFTGDGTHLSLLGQLDGEWLLVTDNKTVRKFGADPVRGLVLSRDGKHDACIQTSKEGTFLLLDGKRVALPSDVPERLWIAAAAFSPDSAHFAYVGLDWNNAYVVQDGKLLGRLLATEVLPPVYSSDSSKLTCVATSKADRGAIITRTVNGKNVSEWHTRNDSDGISAMAQSADGEHVAWGETGKDGGMLVVDGQARTGAFGTIKRIAVSRDGTRVAAADGNKIAVSYPESLELLRRGGVDSIGQLELSGDGESLTVRDDHGRHDFLDRNGQWVQVTGQAAVGDILAVQTDSSHAIRRILEEPRGVQVNDKTVNELRRETVRAEPEPEFPVPKFPAGK